MQVFTKTKNTPGFTYREQPCSGTTFFAWERPPGSTLTGNITRKGRYRGCKVVPGHGRWFPSKVIPQGHSRGSKVVPGKVHSRGSKVVPGQGHSTRSFPGKVVPGKGHSQAWKVVPGQGHSTRSFPGKVIDIQHRHFPEEVFP